MSTLAPLLARRPAWSGPVGVAAIATVGMGVLAWLDPAVRAEVLPGCPFRTVTGLDCPGCGATRALYALIQGDVVTALDHNVLVVAILPVLLWAWAGWLAATVGRRARPPTLPARVSASLAAVVTVFWVVRNLPWSSVAWLGSAAAGG